MQNKLPSKQITEFLDFLKDCQDEYKACISEVWKYDKKQQDQLHDLEFANSYEDRCRVATRIHSERVARRGYKDRVAMTKEIADFCADKQNKQFLERLRDLVEKQKRAEGYLTGERHYNRRGGDIDGDN